MHFLRLSASQLFQTLSYFLLFLFSLSRSISTPLSPFLYINISRSIFICLFIVLHIFSSIFLYTEHSSQKTLFCRSDNSIHFTYSTVVYFLSLSSIQRKECASRLYKAHEHISNEEKLTNNIFHWEISEERTSG